MLRNLRGSVQAGCEFALQRGHADYFQPSGFGALAEQDGGYHSKGVGTEDLREAFNEGLQCVECVDSVSMPGRNCPRDGPVGFFGPAPKWIQPSST